MLEIDFSNSRLVLPSGFVAGIFYDLLLNLLEWKLDIDLNNHFKTFSLNSIIFIMYNNN
jgi:hypothetical protein